MMLKGSEIAKELFCSDRCGEQLPLDGVRAQQADKVHRIGVEPS